ncbi:MAG: glycosyltransferase [Microcoleaceae cyanobacterium]
MIYWITVNYYSTALIERLIHSIPVDPNVKNQVIIVNNSPDDHLISTLESDSILILNSSENLGFGRACNLGLSWVYEQNCQGIIWLINPDAYLSEPSVDSVEKFFIAHPEISILGTVIYNTEGQLEFCGGEFNPQRGSIAAQISDSNLRVHAPYVLTSWVSGCSLLVHLKHFDRCPQFDPDYFLYYEDFDFCQRYAQQGHKVAITHQIKVFHQTSSITGQHLQLKIQQSIYSYLLSLEKYATKITLLYRLIRIFLTSLFLGWIHPEISRYKLQGVWKYLRCRTPLEFF